jgi:hypothetical protein
MPTVSPSPCSTRTAVAVSLIVPPCPYRVSDLHQRNSSSNSSNSFRAQTQTTRRTSDYAQAQMPNGKVHATEDTQAEGDSSCCYGVVDCEPKEIDM